MLEITIKSGKCKSKHKMRYYLTPVGMFIIEKTRNNNMLEKIWRKREKVEALQILFSWAPKSLWTVTAVTEIKWN